MTVVLAEYERLCRKTLQSFEPPIPPGRDPVATVVRTAHKLRRRRRRGRPSRLLNALDAIITAGHAAPGQDIERRVVREIAKMLDGWVLLHYRQGVYLTRRPQREHTLSVWTIHRLARAQRLRARTIRKRDEFWRPDQRRPRGVLSVPIGDGVACIAASRPFTRKEREAVRTVLRFLEARRAGESVRDFLPAREPNAIVAPPLAGEGLIGESSPWMRVLSHVARVATATCPVILHGETGTGKERLARAIHSASHRAQGPFVAVNCGALSRDVIQSELFGHIRGAFTGAERNRQGLIQQAHRGTLFLDEVADMPPPMQVALLRVLEEGQLTPVGASRSRRVDVRIVCASHNDLQDEVAAGRFREDLYHRLNVLTIHLPPLRDRGEDLLLLARHLLMRMTPTRRLHRDAASVLMQHDWPGNVRELDNVLQAAALLSDDIELTPETLAHILAGRRRRTPAAAPAQLGPRTERILAALGPRWLSAPELARAVGVSPRTINRELRKLLDRGLVEAHGQARQRSYRRADAPGAI